MDEWLAEFGEGERVLDIGSAGGSFPMTLLKCSVISIDEDPGAFAQDASAQSGKYRVLGRAQQLPIASASIDLVVCNHALEHFSDVRQCLNEVRRVLKPDGRLFISVP